MYLLITEVKGQTILLSEVRFMTLTVRPIQVVFSSLTAERSDI